MFNFLIYMYIYDFLWKMKLHVLVFSFFFFVYSWAKRSFVLKVINLKFQAYENGYVMPNQYHPDLLSPPLSLSAHLRFGCLSVRKFYWSIHDKFEEVLLNVYELKEMINLNYQNFWVYLYNQNIFNNKYSFVVIDRFNIETIIKNESVFRAAALQAWQHIVSEFLFYLFVKKICKVKYHG